MDPMEKMITTTTDSNLPSTLQATNNESTLGATLMMRLMMMPLSKLVTPTQPSKHGCPSTSNFY
jgi:hypothetical protein